MSEIRIPTIRLPHLDATPLPPVRRVKLHHEMGTPVEDIDGAVAHALATAPRLAALSPGAEVAITAGSRGIAGLPQVLRIIVRELSARGLKPFLVPAMGSHGAGTAEGQLGVLAKLGITPESIGAPIRSSMETVLLGHTPEGVPARMDRHAATADAIVLVNRVKSHTSFDRTIESGLVKIIAVGLGKAEGARNVHMLGARGLRDILPALARIGLQKAPIACGIALVENPKKELVVVEGILPERLFETEERLLRQAKSLLAKLPFDQIDVLVVEQLGKDISGAGMDYAVIGRTDLRGMPNPPTPFVHKLAALGLSKGAGGNGMGLGVADYSTRRVIEQLDLEAMYLNAITATYIEKARLPVILADDAQAIKASCATAWRLDPENARLCIIKSTLHLDEILVSPTLATDLDGNPKAETIGADEPIAFDAEGYLTTRV